MSWKEFAQNYIKNITVQTEENIKTHNFKDDSDLEFYRNRLKIYKKLTQYVYFT